MAIYFPPLFCGQGTTLKASKDFEIEFEDKDTMIISTGDKCIVDDIIGYGYNIKKNNTDKVFRIMNSLMSDYFDIIDKSEPDNDLDNYNRKDKEGIVITLQKDFEIKDVVKILKGQQFLHFIDTNRDGIFHDLFSPDGKDKTLRMKDTEFEKYFK
ncbi:hypothetical protein [Peijinzhouia sedimentorum]